jgi:phosphonate transport system ATP-binding protein
MSNSLIEAQGLVKRFATGRMAVAGVDLSVRPGELVIVLGANGCGKSTLLRCIAGILAPTEGAVHVGGQPIVGLSGRALAEARMAIGMIFQHAHLVKRRSVVANVMTGTLGRHRTFASALGRLPRSELPHALACLDEVGMQDFAPQRAGTLSGGQAQRVSVARALAQRPRALLADEPVASLDPEAAEELMTLLRRVSHQDGLGVLCVLHQPELARRYGDRLVGMQSGRVMFDGPPSQVSPLAVSELYVRESRTEARAA